MTAPTHILTGLASLVVVGKCTGVTPDAVGFLAFLVGTLAPDIDGNGSITRPGTILRRFFGREVAKLLDGITELVSAIVRRSFGHRGFIHSPLVAACIIFGGFYFDRTWLIWLGGGYAAHLLGDALTAGGIPLLSPISSHRTSFTAMKTGSRTEAVVAGALVFFVIGFGWSLLPEQVKATHRQLYQVIAGGSRSWNENQSTDPPN